MSSEALSIITNAEYLAVFKNGRNCHRVDNILTRIYFLCSVNNLEVARELSKELYRIIFREERRIIPEINPKEKISHN